MLVDAACNALFIAAVAASGSAILRYHLAAMIAAQMLTAFFAVWITHRGCEGPTIVARTQRSRLVNRLAYSMFFHLEHHLFPAVPVKRLSTLATRLDEAAPDIVRRAGQVIGGAPVLRRVPVPRPE